MKRNSLVFAALMITVASFGQHRHHGHGRDHRQPDQGLKESLSLDSMQYATIKGINRKYSEQSRTLRHDSTRTFDEKKNDWKRLNDERQTEISKVLTPEQKTKWESLKKERVENRKAAQLEYKARRDNLMKSRLSINDAQLEKMKTARRESFEKARKDYESQLKSILTKEQFDKWKELNGDSKKDRRKRR